MENRQHATVARWIEKLVTMPARRQRSGLRFTIADDAGHDQIRIVERRSKSVAQRVAELTTFVNAAGSFGSHVTGNAARKTELLEQPFHSLGILTDIGVHLAVRTLQ